jgi:hypothetical protein
VSRGTRLRWLHDQGVLPEPRRDVNIRRLHDTSDVERLRGVIASRKAGVEEELEAEGWMTRQKAMATFGIGAQRMTAVTESGWSGPSGGR